MTSSSPSLTSRSPLISTRKRLQLVDHLDSSQNTWQGTPRSATEVYSPSTVSHGLSQRTGTPTDHRHSVQPTQLSQDENETELYRLARRVGGANQPQKISTHSQRSGVVTSHSRSDDGEDNVLFRMAQSFAGHSVNPAPEVNSPSTVHTSTHAGN